MKPSYNKLTPKRKENKKKAIFSIVCIENLKNKIN